LQNPFLWKNEKKLHQKYFLMKKKSAFFFLIFLVINAIAQVQKPAHWSFSTTPEKPKVGDVIDVVFDAKIDNGWYMYSNDFDPELGPMPTAVEFKKNDSFEVIGKLKAINPKKKFDEIWEGDVTYFTKSGRFIQKIKVLKENVNISGKLTFQTCTEADGQCIPGNQPFDIQLTATKTADAKIAETKIAKAKTAEAKTAETTTAATTGLITETKAVTTADTTTEIITTETQALVQDTLTATSEETVTTLPISEEKPATDSLWKFLLLAFGAGVASIFMPCIYPIMPMTVSFFTKQSNGKAKVLFYGISIMAIFAIIGLVTMAFGAPFLNFISTHWLPNLVFFIIFILFGVSLLGAFEIVLPHETVNKIDRMSDKGGYLGIFFMALTLVVVSFSCTVPFVGSLLILAAGGEVLRPLYGMLAFGLPFALVFTLLATFPQYLKNLPKSGGWLNELKVVFGLLEFALALKFLSNIDLAYHFNLLHRNLFLVIWILIFFVAGLYILGIIRLPKDTKLQKIGGTRIIFASLFFAFTAYMMSGVTGKSLSLLSGILPPMPTGLVGAIPTNDKMRALPHGLQGFYDYDDALAYANEVNKPILIDFTGYACANCRKMEENVWSKPEVLERLKNDFVIASLYVDDKKVLPKEKHYTSTYDNELKTTVGDKNMDLEITKFNNNAQPYYAIVNAKGEQLTKKPLGYSSVEEFMNFMQQGKEKF
jgi:thiol:disulfide interchange protein